MYCTMLAILMPLLSLSQADQAAPPKANLPATPAESRSSTDDPAMALQPDMGTWLTNLARHQGHLMGRADPRSASLHVMALLEAAVATSPDCADAYYWLYDIEHRLGRSDSALEALQSFVRLRPDHDAARIRLLELELDRLQTREARADHIRKLLTGKNLSRTFESQLHLWMGRHYYERRETGKAAREIEQALRLNSMNIAARELGYEMFGETEPALQRVEMVLQLIGANPSQANLVWNLGEFLDRLSMHTEAQEWYNRAIELHRRSDAGAIPAEYWHKLAVSYANSGDFEKVVEATDEALRIDAELHTARLLRAHAFKKMGRMSEFEADQLFVSKAYEARMEGAIERKDYNAAAEIAWFNCYHVPNPERAMKYATLAMEDPEPSNLARISMGYALRLNSRADDATKILKDLADTDQLAAYELARAQLEKGNRAVAMTTLHKAATSQYSGIAYALICELLTNNGETPPRPPVNKKVTAALEKFNRDVFDYYKRPADFLRFSIEFEKASLPPVGPVNMIFRLENVGPFPITFGEGFMARPLVALSATVGQVAFENYLQVLLNARPVLLPGDAMQKTVAINVGDLRDHLIQTVSEAAHIEITAMFDPVYEDNELSKGLGTLHAQPRKIVRAAVDVTPDGIMHILDRTKSPQMEERLGAAARIGALLATVEADKSDALKKTLPLDALQAALAGLTSDEEWQVRAVAVGAASWSKLDPRVTAAAAPRVRDDSACVRLLAVRLFASQQGRVFRKVLQHLSETDPEPSVRLMAASYLPNLSQVRGDHELQ